MGKRTNNYISSRVNTVIGPKTTYEGILKSGKETVRIDGTFKGKIYSDGVVIVGNGGTFDGVIAGNKVYVGGTVYGDIYAKGGIEANPTGRIYGNLHTKSLIVDDKAVFEGRCEMSSDTLVEDNAEEQSETSENQ